jgi:hypothetical protein
MNKSRIRIIGENRFLYSPKTVYWWIVNKRIENQSTVDKLIKTLQLKYKVV